MWCKNYTGEAREVNAAPGCWHLISSSFYRTFLVELLLEKKTKVLSL